MAFDRNERWHRLEQYPKRRTSDPKRRERGYNDREFYDPRDVAEEADYPRPSDRLYGRRYDDYAEEEFVRDRGYRTSDRLAQRPLEAQHRERFLRRRAAKRIYPGRHWRLARAGRVE